MPTFKTTIMFNQGSYGWTELYYMEAVDYFAVQARLNSMLPLRAKLLGKGSYITGVRISDEAILNDVFPVDVGNFTTADAVTDTPWNSIYIRAQAGALYRRQFHLRGVPDSWIVIDENTGKSKIPAVARGAFDAWAQNVITKAPVFKLKVMTRTLAPVNVDGIPTVAAAFTKVKVGAVPGLDAVPYVLMRNWRGPDKKLLNRRWDVIGYDGEFLTISLPFNQLTNAAMDYGGKVLRRVPGYSDLSNIYLMRYASKKVGRAFFESGGHALGKVDPVLGPTA